MRIALLFVLLLNPVYGDGIDAYGCIGGWLEFTCRYNNNGQKLKVATPNERQITEQNGVANEWRKSKYDNTREKVSVYQNTAAKYWKVHLKQLTEKDFGDYKCENSRTKEIDLEKTDHRHCTERTKIVYSGENITIDCRQGGFDFICKENSTVCDVLAHGPRPVYPISRVSPQHEGVYWCGIKKNHYKVSREKIHLQVRTPLTTSPTTTRPVQTPLTTSPTTTPPDVTKVPPTYTNKSTKNTSDPAIYTSATSAQSPESPLHPDWKIWVIAAGACVAILLLALMACIIHKRLNSFTKATQVNKEEHCYEEIQERPPQSGPGTALKTIYATATAPATSSGPDVPRNKTSPDETFKDNIIYSSSDVQ